MNKVFISYSSKEYEIADSFRKAFTERGIKCWMAPESIPIGSNYAVEIPKAIENADIFVLILSENSQNSVWVRKEIDLAVNLNKLIFPIKTGNYKLISPFNFYLTDVQMMQASDDTEIIAEKLSSFINSPSDDNNEFDEISLNDNEGEELVDLCEDSDNDTHNLTADWFVEDCQADINVVSDGESYSNSLDDLRDALNSGKNVEVEIDLDKCRGQNMENVFSPADDTSCEVRVVGLDESDSESPMVIINDISSPNSSDENIPIDVFLDAWDECNNRMIVSG